MSWAPCPVCAQQAGLRTEVWAGDIRHHPGLLRPSIQGAGRAQEDCGAAHPGHTPRTRTPWPDWRLGRSLRCGCDEAPPGGDRL